MEEKKGLKILTARNGIALVAVLAILLILTLLIPVMFSMGDRSYQEAMLGTTKLKASYLARTGVEMGVSMVKGTYEVEPEYAVDASNNKVLDLTSEDTRLYQMYYCLKKKTANSNYGVKLNSTGNAYVECEKMWYYIKDLGKSTETDFYISSDTLQNNGPLGDDAAYTLVGYTTVRITYDGTPQYYKTDTDGTYNKCNESAAVDSSTGELNYGYTRIDNNNYIVEAEAHVKGQVARRKAIAVETMTPGKSRVGDEEATLCYTGTSWATSPNFLKKMAGLSLTEDPYERFKSGAIKTETVNIDGHIKVVNKSKIMNYGGVQCFVNPEKANSKQKIKYISSLSQSGEYVDQGVYVYSTIGNMYINVEGSASNGAELKLGVYPGLIWTEKEYEPDGNGSLRCYNYEDRVTSTQQSNFVSFCATNTLEVAMPIELRVNPARVGRIGDGTKANGSLFKVINLQAKDIVIDDTVDNMISLYPAKGISKDSTTKAKRAGMLILSAPETTPYSYYNAARGETVKAGKVYFKKDVYLWLIEYSNDGVDYGIIDSSDGLEVSVLQTIYRTGVVTAGTSFSGNPACASIRDFKVYRMFKAGDVYLFNSDVKLGNTSVGMNLVNWFMETKYFTTKSGSVWDFFKDFRNNIYRWFAKTSGSVGDVYKADDMYYIGNMNDDPTLIAPDVENEMYVVWDN